MAPTPGAAAGTLDRPHTIADRPTGQRNEPRQCIMPSLASDNRAKIRRVYRRGRFRAGQGDRTGLAMAVVKVHIASN